MPQARLKERRQVVAELHLAGASLRDIARQVGVTYETVRRDLSIEGVDRRVVEAAKIEARALGSLAQLGGAWGVVRAEAIDSLRAASKAGNVQASKVLVGLASEHGDSCTDHVPQAEADKWAVRIFEVMRQQVQIAAARPEFASVRAALDDANIDAFELAKEQLDREIGPQSE